MIARKVTGKVRDHTCIYHAMLKRRKRSGERKLHNFKCMKVVSAEQAAQIFFFFDRDEETNHIALC